MSGGVLKLSDGLVLDSGHHPQQHKKWKRTSNFKGKNNGRGGDRNRNSNNKRRR